MDQPVVRYRILVTLVTLAAAAALILGNRHLPAAYQLPAWGAAIGLLSTFGYIVLTWFFDLSFFWIVAVTPGISIALRHAFGFGFGYPRGDYYWLGEGIGLAVMIAIAVALPLRRTSQPIQPQRRTMPPLEEASSHKLILPRMPERGEK